MKRRRKRGVSRKIVCNTCGETKPKSEFYKCYLKISRYRCIECERKRARERYAKFRKKDGVFYDSKEARLMEKRGSVKRIFWNENMIADMKRYYPNTANDELAGIIGVSKRTLTRKAQELGLRKSIDYRRRVSKENSLLGHSKLKELGYPGSFKKGMFTGNQYTGRSYIKRL